MAETTYGKRIGLRNVPKTRGGIALDLGARKGTQTRRLEGKGYRVVSADVTPLFASCIALDANQPLPFDDGTFDVVWCSEVIEHLHSPEAVLTELRRVTRSGGKLILTTPNSGMWLFKVLQLFGFPPDRVQHEGHLHFFGTEAVQKLAPDASILGFFPYAGLKVTLRTDWLIGLLSPTFVICINKEDA